MDQFQVITGANGRRPRKVLEGHRFGRLFAVRYITETKDYECLCECGNKKLFKSNQLKSGRVVSCGCYNREKSRTHGLGASKVYHVWHSMIQRCSNPEHVEWKRYGARGISVCERWLDFENFYADMGDPPVGLSLDRKDNNGNYCKENCKWSTKNEQQRNRRDTRFVTFQGETKPIAAWAEQFGKKRKVVYSRIFCHGWSPQRAFLT